MPIALCRHVLTNGIRCKAAALRNSTWCFYHDNLHRRHNGFRHNEVTRGYLVRGLHVQLDPLEDRESVQVALSVVVNALAVGQLEPKRATALLYGLQLASMNAAKLHNEPLTTSAVQSVTESPEGIALADPAVYEPPVFDLEEDDEEGEEQD